MVVAGLSTPEAPRPTGREAARRPVLFIVRGLLESLPPVMVAASAAARSGRPVSLLCSRASAAAAAFLRDAGVRLVLTGESPPDNLSFAPKVAAAVRFRQAAWKAIRSADPAPLLWIANPHTAVILGRTIRGYPCVIHLLEIDEPAWVRSCLRRLLTPGSAVVTPDRFRSAIVRSLYGLDRTPGVVPNSAAVGSNLERRQLIADPAAARTIGTLEKGSKIVLYQGLIRPDRDIAAIAQAVHEMGRPWRMVVMGRDYGFLGGLFRVCPSLLHIPFVSAPEHLQVTSHAHVGVVAYDFASLNNVFCAPNKIREYGAFGIPMLCSEVPGLTETVGRLGAGICCDRLMPGLVREALVRIDSAYATFSDRARSMFDESEVGQAVTRSLSAAEEAFFSRTAAAQACGDCQVISRGNPARP